MNLADFPSFAEEIRDLQARYAKAHAALCNWGRWSMDRYQIGPRDGRCSTWRYAKEGLPDGYADDHEEQPTTDALRKAEGPDREAYDERAACTLSDRIEGPGGLSMELKRVIRVTYCTSIPEEQLPRECGCLPHAFRERLADALAFAARFA